ncbi:MAG: NADH-quinone oxidoreductase subunit L [Deltaproteobacteria bacterium]|nr:NADH-quinone oxidoreductase subunit L [Deltaproteobacteria bacterium]
MRTRKKASAGKKAFIVNRIGDAGFIFGMALLFAAFGTTRIPEIESLVAGHHEAVNVALITAACIALFIGATGKSAQLPLYVWLPDAMAGPTPVSALIHAATMVTAGVYMVARLNFLYALAPAAMGLVAGVGVVTAFWAALIAFTQTDIKKVLAYSTVSQLGYMFVGVGVGAFTAGIFHLMTHAFFKACLFLGSGAVIHYLHGEQEVARMGGLRRMPGMAPVFWSWIAATLAISGLPFVTSGFFSKDEILWFALASERGAVWIYALGALTAVFTAIYMWRLTILTFFGESRVDQHAAEHPHQPAWTMSSVLVVLGFLSIVGGWIGIPAFLGKPVGIPNLFEHWLEPVFEHAHIGLRYDEHAAHAAETKAFLLGLVIPIVGIALGVFLWTRQRERLAALAQSGVTGAFYRASKGKFFIDELYEAAVIRPIHAVSESFLWKAFDVRLIDGTVNGAAKLANRVAQSLRRIPSGEVQFYAVVIFVGMAIILWALR